MLIGSLVVVLSLALPSWLLLALLPIPVALTYAGLLAPVATIGPAHLQAHDVVLLVSALKLFTSFASRPKVHWTPVFGALLGLMGTLLFANLIAYLKFGPGILLSTTLTLARLTLEVTIVGIMAFTVREDWQLHVISRIITTQGVLIAANIYANALVGSWAFSFGEIQGVDSGLVRSFGVVGDQAGFLLTFFVLKAILARKVSQTVLFAGAVVLTGTIGAVVSLLVGVAAIIVTRTGQNVIAPTRSPHRRCYVIAVAAICLVLLAAASTADLAGLRSRVIQGSAFTFSGLQRLLSAQLALRVIRDNPLTGVGYVGMFSVADRYGASGIFLNQFGDITANYTATAGNQWLQTMTDGGILALGATVTLVVVLVRVLRRAANLGSPRLELFFTAGAVWVISMALGNVTAVWILPGSLISILLWLLTGLAVAVTFRKMGVDDLSRLSLEART